MNESAVDRFLARVAPDPNTGCWLWTGGLFGNGYGHVVGRDGRGSAHRFAYTHFRGPIPSGLVVCHTCDVRACVNPDHLFLGTQADNVADRNQKGRHARGERIGGAKLTAAQVLEIFQSSDCQRDLAARYGVEDKAIWRIRSGRRWAHVTGAAVPRERTR